VKLATMPQIPDLVWSRREAAIYFNSGTTGGDPAIYRMKVPKGQLERLSSLKGRTYWDWLGLSPDDAPLIAHYIDAQEIYAMTVNWP
jgi:hypothetical protein